MLSSFDGLRITPSDLDKLLTRPNFGGYSGCGTETGLIPSAVFGVVKRAATLKIGFQGVSDQVRDAWLQNQVCQLGNRVIVVLFENEGGSWWDGNGKPFRHCIMVTGRKGNDWAVFDPGWNPVNTSPPENLFTLSGHLLGGFTTRNNTHRTFIIDECRAYQRTSSQAPVAQLLSRANSPVEMLVSDPKGAQTGYNIVSNSDVIGIPDSRTPDIGISISCILAGL